MSSAFLTIMQRFTDWYLTRAGARNDFTCTVTLIDLTPLAYQVTCLAKLSATEPFITVTYDVITMMIIKFILWECSDFENSFI